MHSSSCLSLVLCVPLFACSPDSSSDCADAGADSTCGSPGVVGDAAAEGTGGQDCPWLATCAGNCTQTDTTCLNGCAAQANPEAVTQYNALVDCANASGCSDTACAAAACAAQIAACQGTTTGPDVLDPSLESTYDLILESFDATVDVNNLTWSDGSCTMSGGPAHGAFTAAAASMGTPIGSLRWSPSKDAPHGSFFAETDTTSTGSLGPQSGTSAAGANTCDGYSETQAGSYRLEGDFNALSGTIDVLAPMPINPITGGNIGCPPNGGSCELHYLFDNFANPRRSNPFSLADAFSGNSFTVKFSGTGKSAPSVGTSFTGTFSWSGSMKLHAVKSQ